MMIYNILKPYAPADKWLKAFFNINLSRLQYRYHKYMIIISLSHDLLISGNKPIKKHMNKRMMYKNIAKFL